MGWYLDKTMLAHLRSRRLRLLYKMRYLLTNIRHLHHLDTSPFSTRPRSFLNIYPSPQSSKRNLLKTYRSKNFSITRAKNLKCENEQELQMFWFYSTSSRETFKAEAPIGVLQNSRTSLRLHLLRLRLGESFIRLSTHINLNYFKQKEFCVLDNRQDVFEKTQRRAQREQSSEETTSSLGSHVQEASLNLSERSPLTSSFARPQLFHISALASRFGEGYSYVANHINSAFSRSPTKQIHMEVSSDEVFSKSRNRTRRIIGNKKAPCQKSEQTQQNTKSIPTSAAEVHHNNESSSWEEGYLHFARHINRYFGAKVADAVEESPSQSQASARMLKSSDSPPQAKSPGLFHMSSLTTRFGENYTCMANHINRYFKGSAEAEDEEMDQESNRGLHGRTATAEKQVSFFDSLLKPSTIPSLVGSYLGMGSNSISDQTTADARIRETTLYKTVSSVVIVWPFLHFQ